MAVNTPVVSLGHSSSPGGRLATAASLDKGYMNKKPKVQNRSTKDDITVTEVPAACCDDLAAV